MPSFASTWGPWKPLGQRHTQALIRGSFSQVRHQKTIRRQWKRDIVDTSTHHFCANGHGGAIGTRFPTIWREGRKGLKGHHPERVGGLVGHPVSTLLLCGACLYGACSDGLARCLALLGRFEVERRLEWQRLLASPVGLFLMVGWLVLRRVKESRFAGELIRRGRAWWLWSLFVDRLCSPLKPRAILMWCDRAMLKEVDCLPMVKPVAANHWGIRHVCVCLSGVAGRW